MKRPYVQIEAENQIDTLRQHLADTLPMFKALPGIVGIQWGYVPWICRPFVGSGCHPIFGYRYLQGLAKGQSAHFTGDHKNKQDALRHQNCLFFGGKRTGVGKCSALGFILRRDSLRSHS